MRRHEQSSPVLSRLQGLLAVGYRIREQDLSDADNYISLEHPAIRQKLKEKSLFVYDDGSLMGGPRADGTCLLIEPDDAKAFHSLIAATPRPTWWERNNAPFYVVFAWCFIATLGFVGYKVVNFAWDIAFGQ